MREFIAYDMYSQVVRSLRLIKERKRDYICNGMINTNVFKTCYIR